MKSNIDVLLPSKEWFYSHFDYAANVIGNNLNKYIELSSSTVLDFGCGDGITDLGVSIKFTPKKLIGIDITNAFSHIGTIADEMIGVKIPESLEFIKVIPGTSLSSIVRADAIYSWSSFEHIDKNLLDEIISDLFCLLPSGGIFFLQIEPLYYSPFGSHLERYLKEPWAHLVYDDNEILCKLAQAGSVSEAEKDLSSKCLSQESHKNYVYQEYKKLNRITASEIHDKLISHGFNVIKQISARTKLAPPKSLLEQYAKEDLITNEIIIITEKPSNKSLMHKILGPLQKLCIRCGW